MKILFFTTFMLTYEQEHLFTKGVFKELAKSTIDISLASAIKSKDIEVPIVHKSECYGREYFLLKLPQRCEEKNIVDAFINLIRRAKVDIVHSNMIEGYDVSACRELGIPICLTIHVGGLICPRHGANGFLKFDDTICAQPVSKQCLRCQSKNLPFSGISYCLLRMFPLFVARGMARMLRGRQVFYLTEFFAQKTALARYEDRLKLLQYATLLTANERLYNLLKMNGLNRKSIMIPHGVCERRRLEFPVLSANTSVKFYYVGRIHYSKGLHVLFEAFRTIDSCLYELHIIGNVSVAQKNQRYYKKLLKQAQQINVKIYGLVANDVLENLVANFHVMVHPGIVLEVYGIAIAEALSMGRPVLATRCGGAEMQVKDGYNGWLVAPNCVESLRNMIMHIIEHKNEVRDFAQNAVLPHSLREYVESLKKIYEDTCSLR